MKRGRSSKKQRRKKSAQPRAKAPVAPSPDAAPAELVEDPPPDPAKAEVPVAPSPDMAPAEFEDDSPPDRRVAWVTTAIISVLFIGFVYVYGTFGGPWVDELDEQVGEVMAEWARSLAEAGLTEEALETYRQTMTTPFDNPAFRATAATRFADLLYDEGLYDECERVAREAVDSPHGSGGAYAVLYRALSATGKYEEAMNVTAAWYDWGVQNDNAEHRAWARFYAGQMHHVQGERDRAIEAFREVYGIEPTSAMALAAAGGLKKTRENADALALLEIVIREGDPRRRQAALRMKEQIRASAS